MTFQAIALGIVLLGIVILCAKPFGAYIADVMEGKPILALRLGGQLERAIYQMAGIDASKETGWKQYASTCCVFSTLGVLFVYLLQRVQAWLPLNPQSFVERHRRLIVQHGGELRHQYELAGLRRRIDHELPDPDAGSGGSELRVRRDGYRSGGGADSRVRAARVVDHRQFLGRSDAHDAVHPVADRHADRDRVGIAGRHPELLGEQGSHDDVRDGISAAEARRQRRTDEGRQRQCRDRNRNQQDADARRWGRWRRRRRSRSSAPTAAASSMRTRRIPTRIRTR